MCRDELHQHSERTWSGPFKSRWIWGEPLSERGRPAGLPSLFLPGLVPTGLIQTHQSSFDTGTNRVLFRMKTPDLGGEDNEA